MKRSSDRGTGSPQAARPEENGEVSRYARSLVEAVLDPLVTTSPDGTITDVNEATINVTGVTREKIIGTDFSNYFTEPEKVRECYQQVFVKGFVTNYPLTIRHKNGRHTDVLQNASVYKDSRGDVIGVFATARDVTVQKQIEKTLRESEERYRGLFDSIDEGFCIIEMIFDEHGEPVDYRFLQINASFEKQTGLKDAQGKRMRELAPQHERHWFEIYGNIALTGKPARFENRAEQLHRWYDVYAFRLGEPENRQVAILFNDITERRRAEEELRKAKTATDTVNKELEAFSYSVSHDLRAPLRSIDGFSQALLEDYANKLDDTGKNYLQRVRTATLRMGDLIDDLLQLSRVTRDDMRHEIVDLSTLAGSVVTELRRAEPERQIEITIVPGLQTEGDAKLLRIALVNLLSNAWKFTSRQTTAYIELGVQNTDNGRVFYVRDNGVGFDMGYAAKLFGAFQRLHTVSEFPGTGIGLAIVQRIIHRHGGHIWAEAVVNQGATFHFTLPSTRTT